MKQESLSTHRLLIDPLSMNDSEFIFRLLNSEGWIRFIGNRNIKTLQDAGLYIQKIIFNPNADYWVVKLKEKKEAIGIITLIQRDYLEHRDIGFAFLPDYSGQGYAFEAAAAVLKHLTEILQLKVIQAITIPDNQSSIKLLKKLGLEFEKEITYEQEQLHVYSGVPR